MSYGTIHKNVYSVKLTRHSLRTLYALIRYSVSVSAKAFGSTVYVADTVSRQSRISIGKRYTLQVNIVYSKYSVNNLNKTVFSPIRALHFS